MKTTNLLTLILLLATDIFGANAQNRSIDHPMTKAVINAYTKLIESDPKDYETYLHRANEYYTHDEYILALQDVNEALKYTPVSNSDFRFQEYNLRANIYLQTNKPELALPDLEEAIKLDPTSFSTLYLKANTEYLLGNYSAAKADYQKMLRMNTRSPEAYVGLARVAVKENNLGTANDLLGQAVNNYPNDPEMYLRRASVRQMMGNDQGAVDDLIVAMSINSTNPKAVEALVNYADTNYSAVMAGLSNAIAQAPKNALFWYLRAQIAQAHNHYAAALADYQKIIDDGLYSYQGIYASIAECQYYLGQYQKALDNVDYALQSIKNIPSYYVLRSRILRALGRTDEAIYAAAMASAGSNPEGLTQLAICYIDNEQYKTALESLNEASMTNADDPYVHLLKAYLLEKYMNQPVAANQARQLVIDNEGDDGNVKSLRGFALLEAGDTAHATEWMENILSKPDHDGLNNYYGACFFALTGDNDRAIACAEEAMKSGYANYYNWMYNNDAPINVSSLRDDLRFMKLINRYSSIYE